MKVGLFGGTFNPPHYGHLRAGEEVRERLGLGKVLFIPAGNPPLKAEGLEEASIRLSMTEIAVSGNPFFEVSDIECKTREKSYSVDTVRRLKELHPEDELFFVLGIDAFMDLPMWKDPETLTSLVDFIVISRPPFCFGPAEVSPFLKGGGALRGLDGGGADSLSRTLLSGRAAHFLRLTPIGISASEIRMTLGEGGSIKYLLPPDVESFIISHGLYSVERRDRV